MKKSLLISFTCFMMAVSAIVYFASCEKADTTQTATTDAKSYDEIFTNLKQVKQNTKNVTDTELSRIVALMQIENPTYEQTEKALTEVEKINSDDKKKMYYQIGKSSFEKQIKEGVNVKEEYEKFESLFQAMELADIESKNAYKVGFYDLDNNTQDKLLDSYFNKNGNLKVRGLCPYETFPTGLRGVSTSRYYSAVSTNAISNSKGILDCDTKVSFSSKGYAWAATNNSIISLVNGWYGGILNSQNSTNMIVGIKKYLYGLSDNDLKKGLKLAY